MVDRRSVVVTPKVRHWTIRKPFVIDYVALKCKTGGVQHKCAKCSGKKEKEGGGGEGGGGFGVGLGNVLLNNFVGNNLTGFQTKYNSANFASKLQN